MKVIDAGCHVGYYSLLAARQVGPTGTVYAFEPEPGNHELLLRNIDLNGYTNIVPVKKALSNEVGWRTLFLTGLDNGRHSTYHHGLPERGSVEVESTTIDAFLEKQGWPKIDLVKADVEGSERDLLEGMSQLMGKSPELTLVIEFSPLLLGNAGADPLQFLGHLTAHNFRLHRIGEKKEPSHLAEPEWPQLVNELLKNESSVNLYCSRP